MRIAFCLVFIVGICLPKTVNAQRKKGSLYGFMVVVDPGHGGTDPGSSRLHGNDRITENEYTYDVSLRVTRMIHEHGGLTFLTIKDRVGERNTAANKIFTDSKTATFALDGSLVRAGTTGLQKRLAFGNLMARKYPKQHQVWISIHFDVVGTSNQAEGVRIICFDNTIPLVKALDDQFGSANRLRNGTPIVESGDLAHGMRHLYVLSSRNRIRERVLIELGNFLNDKDAWRIRDPKVRETYAATIVRALEHDK